MNGSSQKDEKRKVAVLDAAALFARLQLALPLPCYTTPLVLAEVRDEYSRDGVEKALSTGKLLVKPPSKVHVDKACRIAQSVGEITLSRTDVEVLALALELFEAGYEVTVVTDDYSLQNVAKLAGLKVMPVKTRGIKRTKKYKVVCPACKAKLDPAEVIDGRCPICGSKVSKKAF